MASGPAQSVDRSRALCFLTWNLPSSGHHCEGRGTGRLSDDPGPGLPPPTVPLAAALSHGGQRAAPESRKVGPEGVLRARPAASPTPSALWYRAWLLAQAWLLSCPPFWPGEGPEAHPPPQNLPVPPSTRQGLGSRPLSPGARTPQIETGGTRAGCNLGW